MRNFIVKAIIASVLIFLGVGGGIYVGTALSNRGTPLGISPGMLTNSSYLKRNEKFPDYKLTEYKSENEVSITTLTRESPTLLFFLSTSCDACYQLASFVRNAVAGNLHDDIQIVLIFDVGDLTDSTYYPDSLIIPNARTFITERRAQILEDGLNVMPSVVGLDNENVIKFIMSGYNRMINADFINRYL